MGRFHFAALPNGAYRISYAGNASAQRQLKVDGANAQRSCDLEYRVTSRMIRR